MASSVPGFTTDHHVYSMNLHGHGDSVCADPNSYAWQIFEEDSNALSETHMPSPEVLRRTATYSGRKNADGTWQHKADRGVYANFTQIADGRYWRRSRCRRW